MASMKKDFFIFITFESYCQMLCMEELGGIKDFLYTIYKNDSSYDLAEQFMIMDEDVARFSEHIDKA